MVAPLAGAWIEMLTIVSGTLRQQSLPSRERGLKFGFYVQYVLVMSMSLPSRERGLKSITDEIDADVLKSLPSRERGLKSYIQI